MKETARSINRKNWVLFRELVKTDFKLRYQGSVLGVMWSVLKPLMLFVVMYLVFVRFLKFTDGTPQYPIVLLLGISIWGFFTESTTAGMQSIVNRGDLLRKINFPKYIIVISTIANSLISLGINLLVVLIFALLSGIKITPLALLTPLSIIELTVLVFGLTLITSTLYIKFRDIGHIWDVILQILFYAMPILYPISMVADIRFWGLNIQKIMMLNPIAQSIQDIRHNLISPDTVPTTWQIEGNLAVAMIPIALVLIILIIGLVCFHKSSKKFAEII